MTKRGYHTFRSAAAGRLLIAMLMTVFTCTSVCGEENSPDVDRLKMGRQLLESGNLSEAADVLEQIAPSHQDYQAARVVLVTCYRYIGIEFYGQSRCEDAIRAWRKAQVLEPENTEITGFIQRCESESKAIARISGDSVEVAEPQRLPQQVPPVRVDTVFVPQLIEAQTPTDSIGVSPPVVSSAPISISLSTGIAIGTGNSELQKTGIAWVGSLSTSPTNHRLGVRLDGIYSHWYRKSDDATIVARHRAVSGLSISAVVHSEVARGGAIQLGVGMGVYEIIITEPTADPLGSITRRTSVAGMPLGLSYRRELGPIATTVGVKYTYLNSSLAPNFLQFTVGVASN